MKKITSNVRFDSNRFSHQVNASTLFSVIGQLQAAMAKPLRTFRQGGKAACQGVVVLLLKNSMKVRLWKLDRW